MSRGVLLEDRLELLDVSVRADDIFLKQFEAEGKVR